MDTNAYLRLKHSLWRHAGCPEEDAAGKQAPELDTGDLATWSWRNLHKYAQCAHGEEGAGVVRLAALQVGVATMSHDACDDEP